jgi:hypothetical protein
MNPIDHVRMAGRRPRPAIRLFTVLSVLVLLAGAFLAAPAATPAATAAPSRSFVQSEQWWIGRLDVHSAWKTTKGAGVTVAVVDRGVQGSFGDLQGALVPGFATTGGGNGQTDTDPAQHGTRMADEIAGRGTGFGLLGVAPEAKIMPVAISIDNGYDSLMTALTRLAAMAHPPQVVEMPVGGAERCGDDLQATVTKAVMKGMILVASAGNEGGADGNPSEYPANCVGVVAVGAVDRNGAAWAKTERQPYVSLAGPGVHMIGSDTSAASGYGYADGTSDASAVIAGAFALLRAHFPSLPSRQLVTRMLHTTHQFQGAPKSRNPTTGYGVALPYNAMTNNVPATAANPIYDAVEKLEQSGAPGGSGSSGPYGSGATSTAPGAPSGATTVAQAGSSGGGGGGGSTGVIVGVVIAVLVIALIVVLLLVRRRSRSPAGAGTHYGAGPG